MIQLKLIEQYGFKVYSDDEHIGDICPSGDNEWAAYRLTAPGRVQRKRISTSDDIFDAIDDLEALHYRRNKS